MLTDMQGDGCAPNVRTFTKLLSAQVGLTASIVETALTQLHVTPAQLLPSRRFRLHSAGCVRMGSL